MITIIKAFKLLYSQANLYSKFCLLIFLIFPILSLILIGILEAPPSKRNRIEG